MQNETSPAVVAIFSVRAQAEGAVDELRLAGFHKDQIGIAAPGEDLHRATTRPERMDENAATGAVAGAVAGTTVGALAGAVASAVLPGIGPILGGGLLLSTATGAAAGAALGSFAGPFLALGLSHESVRHYEKEFRAGRTIVAVRTPDRQDEAITILHSHGPLDVEAAGRRVLPSTN
jgi:hypothetical protein